MILKMAFSSTVNPNKGYRLINALSSLSVALFSPLLLAHIYLVGYTSGDKAILKDSNAYASLSQMTSPKLSKLNDAFASSSNYSSLCSRVVRSFPRLFHHLLHFLL